MPPHSRPAGFQGPFRTDDAARALYAEGAGIFRIIPAAVAAPMGADDLIRLVRWAAETGTALVPRGAGSGMPGGNVGPGVVVDLTRGFRRAPLVNPDTMTVMCGAGLTYREVNGAAAAYGLRLPPDPSSGAFCTVGGMVASNAAGARSHRYGAVRRWVDGARFVTADGEAAATDRRNRSVSEANARSARGREATSATDGPTDGTAAERRLVAEALPAIEAVRGDFAESIERTRKNSSGYYLSSGADLLTDLLVGSEGTLGFITDVAFRLAPLPEEPSTLLVTLTSLDDIAPAVLALAPLSPSAMELLDRTYLDFVRAAASSRVPSDTEAVLLVEFEGPAGGAAETVAHVAASTTFAESPEAAGRLWELRHLASPILAALPDSMRSLQVIEDGCVPLTRLAEYIAALRRIALDAGFEIVIFGHAGDGHVHANLLCDVKARDLVPRLLRALEAAADVQIALGGTPAGEHGDGRLRAPFLERQFGAAYLDACRRIKRAMDPRGILNPGVKLGNAVPITAGMLKVGAGAPVLPEQVAVALREIEKMAGYGVDRLGLLE